MFPRNTVRARLVPGRQLARLLHSARRNRSRLGPDLALMRVRRPV